MCRWGCRVGSSALAHAFPQFVPRCFGSRYEALASLCHQGPEVQLCPNKHLGNSVCCRKSLPKLLKLENHGRAAGIPGKSNPLTSPFPRPASLSLRSMLKGLCGLDDASLTTAGSQVSRELSRVAVRSSGSQVITGVLQKRPELAPGVVNLAVPDLALDCTCLAFLQATVR